MALIEHKENTMKFTTDRDTALAFSTFDECLEFRKTLADRDRYFVRLHHYDNHIGELENYAYIIAFKRSTGEEDYVAS